MLAPTVIRVPRARLLLETAAGSGQFMDMGRAESCTITINGDPTITEDFDPNACVRYESSRAYLRPMCDLSLSLMSGTAANIATALLSSAQTVAAAVSKVFTSADTVSGTDVLLSLGWAPAGSFSNGVFTPDPLTSVVDSNGTPATLVLGTDYDWYDPRSGIIQIFDASSFTPPFVVTGDSRATDRAVLANNAGAYRELVLAGVDQRQQCAVETVRLWKVTLETGSETEFSQALDSDEGVPVALTLKALEDPTRALDVALGPFGHWEHG